MEESFWQARWQEGRIGFHEGRPNELLEKHCAALALKPGSHVFVPLCGKAFDLDWLLSEGMRVSGIEFNRSAVEEVFARLGLVPEVEELRGLIRYRSGNLTLFSGDFFLLQAADLGGVDAVYDRASLVAIAPERRQDYADHLAGITGQARQLLIGFDYDQSKMEGPPFAIPAEMIGQLNEGRFTASLLEDQPVTGPMAARVDAREQIWLLTPCA
jgi:thiopurine S-methyltransferase